MTAGWQAIMSAAVEEAHILVTAAAPDAETAAEGEAYIARLAIAAMADVMLGHLFRQGGLACALLVRGGPNPDYRMYSSRIDAARRYRLEGQLNGSERVSVGLYAVSSAGALTEMGFAAFDSDNTDRDGQFALDLAAGALAIQPGCQVMLLRVLHRDPDAQAACLHFTGADPALGLTLATGTADGAATMAARSLTGAVHEYLRWTAGAQRWPNSLRLPPPELADAVNAEPQTHYFLGYFDLENGQWLEIVMPPGLPGYWSLHAYNHWFEHLQTPGVHDRNAVVEADGRIRVRIGPAVPSHLPNRIDTVGRRRGALICRLIDAQSVDAFEVRIMSAA